MIKQFLENKSKGYNKQTFLSMCRALGLRLSTINNVHYWFERDSVRYDCWPSTLRIKGDNGVDISKDTHFDFTERRVAIVELLTSLVEVRPTALDGFEVVAQVYGRVQRLHKGDEVALWDCKHSYSICSSEDTCRLGEFLAPPIEHCDGWLIYEGARIC